MAEPKTKPTSVPVEKFLASIADARVRADCLTIAEMMEKATRAKPRMWGANIVGFDSYSYTYSSGRQADWPIISFSPRKPNITLYIAEGFAGRDELLRKLGRHSCGKVCVYIKSLDDVHPPTLRQPRRRRREAHAQEVSAGDEEPTGQRTVWLALRRDRQPSAPDEPRFSGRADGGRISIDRPVAR